MGFFSAEFHNLQELFVHELSDLLDAEKRICDALPTMVDAAHSPELKEAFTSHLQESRNHVSRLEDIFRKMGKEAEWETCEGMKGLIKEGSEAAGFKGDDMVRDAAMICAAQKVEHYEIAAYGCCRTFAEQLGMHDIAMTLQQSLDEEGATDKKLTGIAESRVNVAAAH